MGIRKICLLLIPVYDNKNGMIFTCFSYQGIQACVYVQIQKDKQILFGFLSSNDTTFQTDYTEHSAAKKTLYKRILM